MKASCKKYTLQFKNPSGTSRGIITSKESWLLILEENGKFGIGECSLLRGLSIDDVPNYETTLDWVCSHIDLGPETLFLELTNFPSIRFGLEQAYLSLKSHDPMLLFPSEFTANEQPIVINGLIWMGTIHDMEEQFKQKIAAGFSCIKIKIGALDFKKEVAFLASIRKEYSKEEIQLRVDANGAFEANKASEKLNILAEFELHSIEQPIRPGNPEQMKRLCEQTPVPIALDEELIGINTVTAKENLLQTIQPQFLVLKPSLLGGFQATREWIGMAEQFGIGWWITSALESNVGLNAIAQFTYLLKNSMPQGLGTGSLYKNNFESPLTVHNGTLTYRQDKNWNANLIKDLCI